MRRMTQEVMSPQKINVIESASAAGQKVGKGRCSAGNRVHPSGTAGADDGPCGTSGFVLDSFIRYSPVEARLICLLRRASGPARQESHLSKPDTWEST